MDTVRRRINGIKDRDKAKIATTVDRNLYTKFDDWPPYKRQGPDALKEEAAALRVLQEYNYNIDNFNLNILENAASATFHLHYQGMIRDQSFNVTSRVTMILHRVENSWKIIHEHFSRFPVEEQSEVEFKQEEVLQTTEPRPSTLPRQEPTKEPSGTNKIADTILRVLREKDELSVIDLVSEIGKGLTEYVDIAKVMKECKVLASKGVIEQTSDGFYLAKFRFKQ